MRWDCRACTWFSADSVGREECDAIGWDYNKLQCAGGAVLRLSNGF